MFGRLSTRLTIHAHALMTTGVSSNLARYQRQGNHRHLFTTRLFQQQQQPSAETTTKSTRKPKPNTVTVATNQMSSSNNNNEKIINLHTIPLEELEEVIVSLGREYLYPFRFPLFVI
jgi:hypothetical protein